LTKAEELQVIEAAKTDVKAFTQLYRLYLPRVYKYCLHRLPTVEIAEDITSQVFSKLVEQLPKLKTQQEQRLSAWLFRVAHNQIVDFYRHNKWEQFTHAAGEDVIAAAPGEMPSTEDEWLAAGRSQQATHVMSQLKDRYQEILSLKFHAELETAEIAAHLDMREKQVYVLLHRALKSFRELYQKIYPETEIF
jgi:RNA polymerase sigma-70 factor (ECF subfamily)